MVAKTRHRATRGTAALKPQHNSRVSKSHHSFRSKPEADHDVAHDLPTPDLDVLNSQHNAGIIKSDYALRSKIKLDHDVFSKIEDILPSRSGAVRKARAGTSLSRECGICAEVKEA